MCAVGIHSLVYGQTDIGCAVGSVFHDKQATSEIKIAVQRHDPFGGVIYINLRLCTRLTGCKVVVWRGTPQHRKRKNGHREEWVLALADT